MNRPCRLALPATVAALLATAAPAPAARPEDLTLRLGDVGAGYVIPADECEPTTLRSDGRSRVVNKVAALPHRSCEIGFLRVWVVPGAPVGPEEVSSRALMFDDPAGPQAALTRPRAVASIMYLPTRKELKVVEPAPAIGDEAVLLQGPRQRFFRSPWQHTIVLWRSGNVLAAVEATSAESADASAQAALRLAATQQARMAAPTPLGPADNDDADVGLSAPGFDLPIYWFGQDLAARGRLPGLTLNVSAPLPTRGGASMALVYGHDATVTVDLWRPRTMRRSFFRSALSMIPCTHRERVTLPQGRATIWSFGGRGCDARLKYPMAITRLPRVVVLLSVHAERGPVTRYATRTGMLRLLRALQPYAAG